MSTTQSGWPEKKAKKTSKVKTAILKKFMFHRVQRKSFLQLGKLKLSFTSPDIILTSPKSFLTSTINFTVLP